LMSFAGLWPILAHDVWSFVQAIGPMRAFLGRGQDTRFVCLNDRLCRTEHMNCRTAYIECCIIARC
jgi:hypothetical protein